jgi:plastocyanin
VAVGVGALPMGSYDATPLPLGQRAKQYTLDDHFFHAAFGTSMLIRWGPAMPPPPTCRTPSPSPTERGSVRNSKFTPHRIAAVSLAVGLGVVACSPSGTSAKSAVAVPPMNMVAGPIRTTPPSTAPTPARPAASATADAKVSITNFKFDPGTVRIKVSTTVLWTNNDIVAHTVTFTDVANSPVLNRGDQFSRTFSAPGTYSYICSIHPFMHGTVVVSQ